jgi:glucose-6-phosphate 3-dehydrogenase
MIIGVIGCGGIARAHVRALALIELVKELVLYDVNAQSMVELGKLWPRAVTFGSSVADLAERSDAFIVCTPNHLHYPVIAQVLEHKRIPFVCEKPLACNYAAAQRIVHVAPAASIVSFNYRYNPMIQYISGACKPLGRLNCFSAEFNKDSAITRNHLTWRDLAQQSQSSGALGDLSCHLLDLFCVLARQKITVDSVRVVKGTRIREKRDGIVEVDDNGYVFGRGEKGAFFKVKSSKSEEEHLGLHLNLVFEKGEISYSSRDENMLTIRLAP